MSGKPARGFSCADDEKVQPWLRLLLDAYAVIDEGVASGIAEEVKKRGFRLACSKGCGNCCATHRDIPVYPLELIGIYWFVIEKIGRPLRSIVKKQLLEHRRGGICPFLVDAACSIHQMRPAACRQFNVFNKPCESGEDPFYTRRADVLTPISRYIDKAFSIMLPFYGITDKREIKRASATRLINSLARPLQLCPWHELPARMDEFDISKK
ncbi:MAG TPA: YkgJ family cysteine cluster protein [Dissulfurispiraceae bacterium]|nr:YkgJ family cysteine cluster protein [Dissulfurispiraceae bacterium]